MELGEETNILKSGERKETVSQTQMVCILFNQFNKVVLNSQPPFWMS